MALIAPKKKGGPYPKGEQLKRRDEVYKLHFEYGYSERKISEFLKINRGTINRDIMYCYTTLNKNWRHIDSENYVMKQVERFEIQRTRLRKQLDSTTSFRERIILEKFLFELDVKIANFQIKFIDGVTNLHYESSKEINSYFEKEKINQRVVPQDVFLKVSPKAKNKIIEIYHKDMNF